MRRAADNGVHDLRPLGKAEIAALEPELFATEGLFSPSTGIIDSHAYMLALLGDAEAAGASLVREAEVTSVTRHGNGYRLTVSNAGETLTLDTAASRQQRRALGPAHRRPHGSAGPAFRAADLSGERQLRHPECSQPLSPSGLSGAGAGRAGRASDPGHGRGRRASARMSNGWRSTIPPTSIMPCRPHCRPNLRPASPPIGLA